MKLFGSPVSPFVRKVLVYGAEKGLDIELVGGGLDNANPEFLEASPFKKMPGFSDGDFKISDSTAIITYLEAKYPEPVMLPADPAQRARVIWYEEFSDTILFAAGSAIFFNRIVAPKFRGIEGDEAAAAKGEVDMGPLRDYLEGVIPASGFLVGDRLTLADIAVASPFVNLAHCNILTDAATHPKLTAYLAAMHARPSFAAWIVRERKILGM
ncbi:MAG: glutathione S-transferase family protein [Sphingorhabdus sp.]